MEQFFASGHAVDFVLAVIAVELVVLVRLGHPLRGTVLLLLPAVFILLGLRAALVDAAWPWVALPLMLAFPAHLMDVVQRLKDRR